MSRGLRWTPDEVRQVRERIQRPAQDEPGSFPPVGIPGSRSDVAPHRRQKYGATRTVVAGIEYDSKAEAVYALTLEALKSTGTIRSYRRQVPIAVVKQLDGTLAFGELVTRARVDFEVTMADGSVQYVESKGVRVRDWPVRERTLLAAGAPLVVKSTRRKRKGARRD